MSQQVVIRIDDPSDVLRPIIEGLGQVLARRAEADAQEADAARLQRQLDFALQELEQLRAELTDERISPQLLTRQELADRVLAASIALRGAMPDDEARQQALAYLTGEQP